MSKFIRREVRCCCQPQKLLGWMDVREDATEIVFPILRNMPLIHFNDSVSYDRVVLRIAKIVHSDEKSYLAIRAEDIPLETLRRLPGFIEATDADHNHF